MERLSIFGDTVKAYENILETIGNTPIVKINRIGAPGNRLFAKLEFFNPGGSVKDRMAKYIIEKAEKA